MNESAEFRALRELLGLTQNDIAAALSRTRMCVKYWENPDFATNPPAAAWEYMEARKKSQTDLVSKLVAEAEKAAEEDGGAKRTRLPFYRDQKHYDVNHEGEEGGIFGAANAAACTAAVMLMVKGYEIEWYFPPTPKAKDEEKALSAK